MKFLSGNNIGLKAVTSYFSQLLANSQFCDIQSIVGLLQKLRGMKIKLMLAGVLLSFVASAQSIDRVEPPNWWVGMKKQDVQLMVYGKDIKDLNPVLESETVTIERVIKVENPNYLFINLKISEKATPGIYPIKFYRGRKLLKTWNYQIDRKERKSEEVVGFDASDVMYLITPDRFANGDPTNDEYDDMPDKLNMDYKFGRHGGDIRGMVDHLDYINKMGFTAIWLNPIIENDMLKDSYHGYAATDFYKIDRRFGTNEEYRQFCQQAEDKGIKIIMDMIMNHCGSEHWFVKDPPTSDWINYQDNYVQTSHIRNVIQDIHASEYDKKAFSDGWFVETMPDLNQRNDLMATYLIQNTLWWIEYSGVSGIRMDTYPYPDKHFMADWTCAVLEEYPNVNIVGEEWTTNPAIVSYWQKGKVNHDGYTSCLPSVMDFPLQNALKQGLIQEEKNYGSGLIETYKAVTMDFLYADPYNLVIFPDNHDMDRFFTQVEGDYDLFKMGMIFIATMRGVPQVYYGTEILMENDDFPGDHGIIRTDFPGGWPNDEVNAFTGEGLTTLQKDAQGFTRKLMNWRKTSQAVHHGELIHFAPENGTFVYFRMSGENKVMVVLNKNNFVVELTTARFAECLQGTQKAAEVMSGNVVDISEKITLEPKRAYVFELK